MAEKVNHPQHYGGDTTYEVIKVLEAWNPDWAMGFCWGNAIKYQARAGRKDNANEIEDREKAVWYSRKLLELQKRHPKTPPPPHISGGAPVRHGHPHSHPYSLECTEPCFPHDHEPEAVCSAPCPRAVYYWPGKEWRND